MDITVGKIVSYLAGGFTLLMGLAAFTSTVPGGVILVLTGLFVLPPVRQRLADERDINFSRRAVMVLFIAGFVVGAGALGSTIDTTDTDSPAQNQANPGAQQGNQNPDSSSGSQQTVHEEGETFSVGSGEQTVQYTVLSSQTASSVGSDFSTESADAQFVIVEVEMTNQARESFYVSSNQLKLTDSQGREYETDTDAMVYVEGSMVFEQLDPGVTKSGYLVYDAPADQQSRQLKISPAGMFSTAEEHYVNLNV